MDEMQMTVETLIEMDEPEALLETLRRHAGRMKGKRWQALTSVLDEAAWKLDAILNAKPAGPDFRPPPAHATGTSQPEPQELTHGKHPDAAPEAAAAATPAAEAPPA